MREFTITFKNDVKGSGADNFITFVKAGETRKVNEVVFERIRSGLTITGSELVGHGMWASYSFTKKDLEKEVIETEVIINTKVRKLRN